MIIAVHFRLREKANKIAGFRKLFLDEADHELGRDRGHLETVQGQNKGAGGQGYWQRPDDDCGEARSVCRDASTRVRLRKSTIEQTIRAGRACAHPCHKSKSEHGTRIEASMSLQKVLFMPGFGVAEAIRSIRFVPKPNSVDHEKATHARWPQSLARVEVWQGDRYGEPTQQLLTEFSTSDRTATVYANGEMPLVGPSKSAVALVHGGPDGFEIEFESEFSDPHDRTVRRTVSLDSYGTRLESLCDLKSLAPLKSIAFHREGDLRPPRSMAQSLGFVFRQVTASISRFFRLPLPSLTSQSHDNAGASKCAGRQLTGLGIIPRAPE
jgi:hypothetical protein